MKRIRMLSYVGCMGVLMSAALLFGCANDVVGAIPDTTPPAEVTNLVVSAGDSSITVSWNEPVDSDFAKVEILYSGSVIATIAKGTFLTTASNLTNGVTYTFTVRTVDAKGNSSAGQTISATPAASSSTPTVDTPTVDTPTVDT
ncbi:MAG TPA: fibronectin type III domain-containing protein, partial [Treponemataceae bacterium]|nr:fibronectin type III domain-containing protein [Treponemataceae bacterium]